MQINAHRLFAGCDVRIFRFKNRLPCYCQDFLLTDPRIMADSEINYCMDRSNPF